MVDPHRAILGPSSTSGLGDLLGSPYLGLAPQALCRRPFGAGFRWGPPAPVVGCAPRAPPEPLSLASHVSHGIRIRPVVREPTGSHRTGTHRYPAPTLVVGNPGDVKPVGEGVSELRIDYG